MVEGQLNKSGLNPDNFRKTLNGKEINLYTLQVCPPKYLMQFTKNPHLYF